MNYIEEYKQLVSREEAIKDGVRTDITYDKFEEFNKFLVKGLLPKWIKNCLQTESKFIKLQFLFSRTGDGTGFYSGFMKKELFELAIDSVIPMTFMDYISGINGIILESHIYGQYDEYSLEFPLEAMINYYYEELQRMEYEEKENKGKAL